jgi:hypothetical protein
MNAVNKYRKLQATDDKKEIRKANSALNDLIRRAKRHDALINESKEAPTQVDSE